MTKSGQINWDLIADFFIAEFNQMIEKKRKEIDQIIGRELIEQTERDTEGGRTITALTKISNEIDKALSEE